MSPLHMKKIYNKDDKDRLQAIMGRRMRAARKALGLTQTETARRIGLSAEFYARVERGKALPGAESLAKIADVLDISVDDLFGRDIHESPIPLPTPEKVPQRIAYIVAQARNNPELTRVIIAILKLFEH